MQQMGVCAAFDDVPITRGNVAIVQFLYDIPHFVTPLPLEACELHDFADGVHCSFGAAVVADELWILPVVALDCHQWVSVAQKDSCFQRFLLLAMPCDLHRLFPHPVVDGDARIAGASRKGESILCNQLIEVSLRLFDCHMHYLLPFWQDN